MKDENVGTSLIEAVARAHGEQFHQQQENIFEGFGGHQLANLQYNFSPFDSFGNQKDMAIVWFDAK